MELILGDCLEKMKELEDNSIDAIVTDPPYGLSFMGKKWDYDVPSVDIWKECLRVLKPGGYLLSFAGTRTQHRMAVNIEDAGFEIRDMIAWVYGCLSFDTEVLTEKGFRRLHKLTQYDRIAVYDTEKNIYKWERPQRWNIYQVNEDTAYRIKSDYTDQIVSRNHRCLVEREGKLIFIQAEELNDVEYMPTLSGDFLALQKNISWALLFKNLLWQGKGLAQKVFGKWIGKEVSSERTKDGEKSSLERWSNLFSQTRELQTNKVCAVSEAVFADGTKRRLCNGTSFDFSQLNRALPVENGSSASHQSQSAGQPIGEPDVIRIKQGTQITRRARVEKITYSGIIFCPTVSTGAFVARRNGRVFITGNSGFPKSLNIGKAVDKIQGNERETIGTKRHAKKDFKDNLYAQDPANANNNKIFGYGEEKLTKGTSEWEGWGTALKPAVESITVALKPFEEKTFVPNLSPIIMSRKPLEKGLNVAQNCLKWGVGGINIDESRIPTDDNRNREQKDGPLPAKYGFNNNTMGNRYVELSQLGRFPANLIHDGSEEVVGLFPQTGNGNGGKPYNYAGKEYNNKGTSMFNGDKPQAPSNFNDSGSAARFFYCAKASKRERNMGCEELEERFAPKGNNEGRDMNNPKNHLGGMQSSKMQNFHPTVKPIALMKYLVKLVSREGQVVLDPFMGSGTTGMACKKLGRDFVGIEMDEDYMKIARARTDAWEADEQLKLSKLN